MPWNLCDRRRVIVCCSEEKVVVVENLDSWMAGEWSVSSGMLVRG